MIAIDRVSRTVNAVKIIDFGTSLLFESLSQYLTVTTPEYMPPEILNHIELKSKIDIAQKLHPWSFDIWSLGIMIIELVHGFPIYMAYKSRISRKVGKETANSTLQKLVLGYIARKYGGQQIHSDFAA